MNKRDRKLALHPETVLPLDRSDDQALRQIAGGLSVRCCNATNSCPP